MEEEEKNEGGGRGKGEERGWRKRKRRRKKEDDGGRGKGEERGWRMEKEEKGKAGRQKNEEKGEGEDILKNRRSRLSSRTRRRMPPLTGQANLITMLGWTEILLLVEPCPNPPPPLVLADN
ncbi:hypothetical protein Pcinc_036640 [Petrolisthes cinctipes]|uniref:Uncharacterized protein n=1 Tax=Petrolisthes cinctipes TaxID=88211 RepID=A0AAE1ENH0_PETCI|nr:hypothetical protein Pcinc_036640 [Petrolisthes cinctipes]